LGDDDYRHRRRGRGGQYVDPGRCSDRDVDQVHSFVMMDRLDECLEDSELSVAVAIEEEDFQDFDSSPDVLEESMCLDDNVSCSDGSMNVDSHTDGDVVSWTVTSNPTSPLINTEWINRLKVSERGVVNQFAGDQLVVLDLLTLVRPLSIGAAAEQGVSVGPGWQGANKFHVDGISGWDYPSGVGCTVADSNADGESVDALINVNSVHQTCDSDSAEPSGRSVLHWRYDQEAAIGRCGSLADHFGRVRSRHDRVECLVSSMHLYLPRTVGTRCCRGWTRMIFDPGGIGYGLYFCTLVLSSLRQGLCTARLCYNLYA
jgi:hypothetical protein